MDVVAGAESSISYGGKRLPLGDSERGTYKSHAGETARETRFDVTWDRASPEGAGVEVGQNVEGVIVSADGDDATVEVVEVVLDEEDRDVFLFGVGPAHVD